jgi:polyvinyl alcohol dehydrogenase (cytochrome)
MRQRNRFAAATASLAVATAVLAGACASSNLTDAPIAGGAPPATSPPGEVGSWPAFGYDTENARFNADEAIVTRDNVGGLVPRWSLDGLKGVTSTPVVNDGVVYFGDWNGAAHAVSIADGSSIWKTDLISQSVMSSVAVHDDAVYVATNSRLFRLERTTGEKQWEVTTSPNPIAITPATPVVVDDKVILGVASGELMVAREKYSFRGSVTAYGTEDGSLAWQYWLTKGDGTEGAGVGVWSTPAIDSERGLLYVGTGNTYEPPASPNADSIIALRYATGEVAWQHQFTFPDVFSGGYQEGRDADVGAGPNLWESDGRALVGAGDKTGTYYALDRDTGEIVWQTAMTGGSALGGVIGTSAVDDTNIYVGSNVGDPETYSPTGKAKILALSRDGGAIAWEHEVEGAIYAPISVSPGVVYAATVAGTMYALDATDGRELWSHTAEDQVGGGATIVDGTVLWGWGFALFSSGSGKGGLLAFRPGGGNPGAGGSDGTIADETTGARLYRTVCASCHGRKGEGGIGPSLVGIEDRMTVDQHVATVNGGRGSQMPAFQHALTPDEVQAIVEYERTQL